MDNRFQFRAQRESGEWIYFTLEELATDSRLQAEWKRLKNQTGCTGLKDKNGKLIFEGDILRSKGDNVDAVYWGMNGTWHLKSFVSQGVQGWCLGALILDGMEFEIIGNIYENSESLNQPK